MSRRGAAAAASLAAAAVYVTHALVTSRVTDDCFITFRYARNWVAGFGPVFNPPPYERVEGYTNFLWLALLAGVRKAAPAADLLLAAQTISLACGAAVLAMVARFAFARREEARALRAFAPLLLALHAPFVAWSTAGLETMLYALLVFAAAIAELREGGWRAPALLALAAMARPDAVAFFAALLLHRACRRREEALGARRPEDEGAGACSSAAAGLLVFALLYAPYWVWRWRYYGQLLPNTFYAKVGGGLAPWKRGGLYLLEWALQGGVALALLPAVAALRRWREPWVRLFALFACAGAGFALAVGGDGLGLFRFLVPVAPFCALLAQEGLLDVADLVRGASAAGARRAAARALAAAVVAVSFVASARPTLGPTLFPRAFETVAPNTGLVFPGDGRAHSYRWFDPYFVDRLAAAGRWLDRHAPSDALVASSPAGSIGFHMRQPLLDMLGLNDAHISHVEVPNMGSGRAGHEKGDGRYVLSRRPRYVLLGNVAVAERPLSDGEIEARAHRLKSERELLADPEFHRLYEKRTVELGEPELAPIAPENRRLFRCFTFFELRSTGAGGR